MNAFRSLRKRGLALFLALTMCLSLLPATALAAEMSGPYCGKEEHTHEPACYENQLICILDVSHEHTDACYVSETPVCGLEEGHVHGDECWTPLVGMEPADCWFTEPETDEEIIENKEHVHDLLCYGLYDSDVRTVCGPDEGHEHTPECYEYLSCGQVEPEEPHTHDETCFTSEEPVCGLGHEHGAECFKNVLICVDDEHTHSDECYVDSNAEIPSEVPTEVQTFLNAAALPQPGEISEANAAEAGEQANAADAMYEALYDIDPGYWEREDVIAAYDTVILFLVKKLEQSKNGE